MELSSTANARDVCNILRQQYVTRGSGSLHFHCNGQLVIFSIRFGDVVGVSGGPIEEGVGNFRDYLFGRVENVCFSTDVPKNRGVPVEKEMELLLFELAVGMDRQLAAFLDDAPQTGKPPKEKARTATVNFGSDKQLVIILKEGANTVGRSEENDISIDDPGMSRIHACVRVCDGIATLENLQSANGVRLNRKPVEKARLEEGNYLFIGTSVFQFFWLEGGAGILFKVKQDDTLLEDGKTSVR